MAEKIVNNGDLVSIYLAFFTRSTTDSRLGPIHIAVYTAIFEIWIKKGCVTPVTLFSSEVLPVAKLSTRMTYHRILKELGDYGYLLYTPSFNKYRGSKIILI